MKKFLCSSFLLVPITCLALVGCTPKNQAECFLDVSKNSETERAAIMGASACIALFPEKVDVYKKAELKYPKEGHLHGEWVFKGGDWNDEARWSRISVGDQFSRPSLGKGAFSFNGGDPEDDRNWSPTIGAEVDGFIFKGGDPHTDEAWVKKDSVNGK